jgi:hypothetical protein
MLMIITLTGFSKPVKVTFTYSSEDISLIYNDMVFKGCPKELAIDFQLGGQLIAFKSGYESKFVKISKDNIFTAHHVQLDPMENKFEGNKLQVDLKNVSFMNYVTNFTAEEVTEIIRTKLYECSIVTYSQNKVFKNANATTKQLSIGAEVIKSTSKNGAYTSPYYLFSSQKIKWLVLDNTTNELILEYTTEGFYPAAGHLCGNFQTSIKHCLQRNHVHHRHNLNQNLWHRHRE